MKRVFLIIIIFLLFTSSLYPELSSQEVVDKFAGEDGFLNGVYDVVINVSNFTYSVVSVIKDTTVGIFEFLASLFNMDWEPADGSIWDIIINPDPNDKLPPGGITM